MQILLLLFKKLIEEGFESNFSYLFSHGDSFFDSRFELFIFPSSDDDINDELPGSLVSVVSDFVNSDDVSSIFFRIIIKDHKPCLYVYCYSDK